MKRSQVAAMQAGRRRAQKEREREKAARRKALGIPTGPVLKDNRTAVWVPFWDAMGIGR